MEQLQHTNIVKFYGVCKGGMICLFDSLCPINNLSVINGRVFLG